MAKKKRKKLTPEQIEQRVQEREIRAIFSNLGFKRIPKISGKHFMFDERRTELDDIFVCENLILITEYTLSKNPKEHFKNKTIFYNKVIGEEKEFIDFIINEPKLSSFKEYYDDKIKGTYTLKQLRLKILYCSKNTLSNESKNLAKGVSFFDYHIVQYFKSLSKVIKRTGKYEICEFLNIPFEEFGDNIRSSEDSSSSKYVAHILPEEKSSFKEGYKIVSFYIDAGSLMRRAYVLRQEGWRKKENIGYYQRMFNSSKMIKMRKYLVSQGRVFINNIIATISEGEIKLYDKNDKEIEIDSSNNFKFKEERDSGKVVPARIEITDKANIIGLIDGQHRTFAYHEGNDSYEAEIKKLREVQNLLVTGIIFPRNETPKSRLQFEAELFTEINSNQTNVPSKLKQEIELMLDPYSPVSIGKAVLINLNENGPLENLIEQYSFDKNKLKTASIVSFGLRPLLKLDDTSKDTLFHLWSNKDKLELKEKENETLLQEYIDFCTNEIRKIFIATKSKINKDRWTFYNKKDSPNAVLNVTFFNGFLNVLRLIIENNLAQENHKDYISKLEGINNFNFKAYKSSQYRKMGKAIFDKYFKTD